MSIFEQQVFKMWISDNKSLTEISEELNIKLSVIRKAVKK